MRDSNETVPCPFARELMENFEDSTAAIEELFSMDIHEEYSQLVEKLSLFDLRILRILKREGRLRMSDIAQQVNLASSSVTSLVDKLEEMNIVQRTRSQSDRRVVHVRLSKKGEEIACYLMEAKLKFFKTMLFGFNEEECREFLRLISCGLNNIKQTYSLQ